MNSICLRTHFPICKFFWYLHVFKLKQSMIKVSEMKIRSKVEWNFVNRRKTQSKIWRLQNFFYDCSRQSEKFKAIKLQKILINLLEAKLLAVQKVTQGNRGKKTVDVDGVRFISTKPKKF